MRRTLKAVHKHCFVNSSVKLYTSSDVLVCNRNWVSSINHSTYSRWATEKQVWVISRRQSVHSSVVDCTSSFRLIISHQITVVKSWKYGCFLLQEKKLVIVICQDSMYWQQRAKLTKSLSLFRILDIQSISTWLKYTYPNTACRQYEHIVCLTNEKSAAKWLERWTNLNKMVNKVGH